MRHRPASRAKGNASAQSGSGRVAAYLRVSTDGQEDGQGLEVQRQHIAAYTAANGLKVDDWYQDVESGAKEDRPQLADLRAAVASGAVAKVLIYRVDRLARDSFLAESLWREMSRHASVVSVSEAFDGSLTGNLMRQILQAFAEYERAVIATRTRTGRRESVRKHGTFAGGPGVFGYRPVGKRGAPGKGELQIDKKEAQAIRLVFTLAKERKKYQVIADALNAAGHKTAEGKAFERYHILRILRRETFYRAQEVLTTSIDAQRTAHEPILS